MTATHEHTCSGHHPAEHLSIAPLHKHHLDEAVRLLRSEPGVSFHDWEVEVLRNHIAADPHLTPTAYGPDGRVLGVLVAGILGVRGMICHLVVDQEARRAGVARRLVEALMSTFADRGMRRVFCFTTGGNSSAEDFWEAMGFSDTFPEKTFEFDLQ